MLLLMSMMYDLTTSLGVNADILSPGSIGEILLMFVFCKPAILKEIILNDMNVKFPTTT